MPPLGVQNRLWFLFAIIKEASLSRPPFAPNSFFLKHCLTNKRSLFSSGRVIFGLSLRIPMPGISDCEFLTGKVVLIQVISSKSNENWRKYYTSAI